MGECKMDSGFIVKQKLANELLDILKAKELTYSEVEQVLREVSSLAQDSRII